MTKNTTDLALIIQALEFSATKHKDQRRKDVDASPYINHPIALAKTLCVDGGVTDVNVICGALLHDTIEDTKTTAEELTAIFGEAITKIVQEVTDDKTLTPEVRKLLQIEHAAHASHQAQLIKLADKICNLHDIHHCPPTDWSITRKQEYFDWAKKVVDKIRDASPELSLIFDELYAQKGVKMSVKVNDYNDPKYYGDFEGGIDDDETEEAANVNLVTNRIKPEGVFGADDRANYIAYLKANNIDTTGW